VARRSGVHTGFIGALINLVRLCFRAKSGCAGREKPIMAKIPYFSPTSEACLGLVNAGP
jgi:hypothetical protein